MPAKGHATEGEDLAMFACPNPDCDRFNQFNAGNLSVVERMGKDKAIRRLYCNHCQHRFSERQGSLFEYSKLPRETVVRILKCLGHGCSIEATADICQVDARSVERMLERAGRRAENFHHLQLDRLKQPLEAVELDELHGRVYKPPGKKGVRAASRMGGGIVDAVAAWVGTGFTPPWRFHRGS
jgi:transposase-like protein